MTTASQTPGALPPETPRGGPRATMPINPDVPAHLLVLGSEPVMPECRTCGTMPGMLQACPQGLRYQSGAQVLYCTQHLPTPTPVQAAEGVITAAMEHGAVTPRELAQAEHDAGLLFDPQAAEDIAAAAAEQAHADDAAEIAERGRQLARVAGTVRQRDAVLRLCEGRPGTDLLTVAAVAAAAEYGSTPFDSAPMTLTWSGEVDIPGPGDARKAVVRCTSPYGGRADLVVQDADRAKLASLVGTEARDVHAACPTWMCGTADDYTPEMFGWARLEVAGIEDDAPRWYCSAACVFDAVARAGEELAAADQAAAVDPGQLAPVLPYGELVDHRYGDPLAYGPSGIPCGCGKPAHSNLVPCKPDGDVSDGEDPVDDVARCVRCGCTDAQACEGGCHWVANHQMVDLCSRCANPAELAVAARGLE